MPQLLLPNLTAAATTLAGMVLLALLLQLQERRLSKYVAHHLGWRAVLITGWLGVTLHETAHLLACWVFGHRVVAYKLFDPDPVSGTLGYVRHAYSRRNAWQLLGSFFIGLAPFLLGGLALCGLLYWMVPTQTRVLLLSPWPAASALSQAGLTLGAALWAALQGIAAHASWWLPLQLYLAVCVASHLAPSRADLSGALPGSLLVLVLTLGGAAGAAYWEISLSPMPLVLLPLLLFYLLASFFHLAVAVGLGLSLRLARGRRRGLRVQAPQY